MFTHLYRTPRFKKKKTTVSLISDSKFGHTYIIIQQIVTMPIYGQEALVSCHPYMTDVVSHIWELCTQEVDLSDIRHTTASLTICE